MRPMDHAEAHERIADLALEPRRLAELRQSDDVDDVALRAHLDSCAECRADVADWGEFQTTIGDAVAANHRGQLEPMIPPADLRRRVLAAAQADRRLVVGRAPGRRPSLSGRALLALAAVLAIVAVGLSAWVVREQSARLEASAIERQWHSDTVAALTRVLATSDHRTITLRTANGASAGTIAWSRHDLVVLAGGLPAPPNGQAYRCWLDYEGVETAVGRMWFVDGNAFWTASTQNWAAIDLDPDKTFLVTLEPVSNQGPRHTGPVVLQANLGG